MPIINKGIFDTDVVFQRQLATDWPSVNTNIDLYVEDLIASGNLIANGLIIRNIEVSDNILTGNITAATITANTLVLDILTSNVINADTISANVYSNLPTPNLSQLTTDDLLEGSTNLYFTLTRARQAYSPGAGINITANGLISTKGEDDGSGVFNTGLILSNAKFVDEEYSNVAYFSNAEGSSFILYSMHLTNLTSEDVYLTGRYQINDSNILFANLLRLPGDSSMEFLRKPQVFKPGDTIQLKTYDSAGNPANNLISSYLSYQSKEDDFYERQATSITSNTLTSVYFSNTKPTVVESIILNNLSDTELPVTTVIANESDQVIAYLTSNLRIPKNTFIEICETPKVLKEDYSIKVHKFDNPKELSVFVSSKVTAFVTVTESSSFFNEGSNIFFDIQSRNYPDASTLYYTLDILAGNITQQDLLTPISGTFQIFDGVSLIRMESNADNSLNYEGDVTFNLLVRKGSESGTIVARSGNVTLIDSSNLYAFNLQATGGTVIDEGGYRYHIFEESGSFQVFSTAEDSDRNIVQYLAVAGGGGMSTPSSGNSGGGGGEVIDANILVSVSTYNVIVGAGGAQSANGTNTEVFSQVVIGGGGGSNPNTTAGKNGASGGGGSVHPSSAVTPIAGGSGIAGRGNPGAAGIWLSTPGGFSTRYGGGGGGATTQGLSVTVAPVNTVSAFVSAGGYGKSVSWVPSSYGTANVFDSALRVFGGGGDGQNNSGTSVPGPLGPQVQVLNPPAYPTPGPTHGGGYVAGGGGGGSARTQPSTTGHSGIVIIRYPFNDPTV